jgi:hypothetical protein
MAITPLVLKPLASAAPLSKSKFVHGIQCPLYLWIEVRTDAPRPEFDAFTRALFAAGHEVGEYARQRWDRRLTAAGQAPGVRVTEDPQRHTEAVAETAAALVAGASVIHEAAFTYEGVKVRVDVLERLPDGTFALNEVKSTTKYDEAKHLLDASVQMWVLRNCGLEVSRVNLVHLNKQYEWPGGDYDLDQLFVEEDITASADALQEQIGIDVARLLRVVRSHEQPVVPEGTSCEKPYGCPYAEVCPVADDPIEHPIAELPGCRRGKGMHKAVTDEGFTSLLELSESAARRLLCKAGDATVNPPWYYTWKATVTGERIVLPDCSAWLGGLQYPILHLDFETIASPLPMVSHTHPFEQVPLQYSLHMERRDGTTEHREFLADATDPDPRRSLIERLLADLDETGTILRWSAFETTILTALAKNPRYEEYRARIELVLARIEDLGKTVNDWVFDKDFHGRWSIKKVYPTLVPGGDPDDVHEDNGTISYDELDGVARGDEAAMALLEYLRPGTANERRAEIRRQLLQYCELDTWAMVEILRVIRGECEVA